MKRVGLYLSVPPHGGGTFQYASSILTAFRSLAGAGYHPVVAYAHPAWAGWLRCEHGGIEHHLVTNGLRDTIARSLLRAGVPAAGFRRSSLRLGGMEGQLHALQCDLWIFPAQDYLSYSMPGPTIGTIHDLMHRHESRFPEVSVMGLYHRREQHYRNMCSGATAILVDSELGKQHVLEAYPSCAARIHVLPYIAPSYIADNRIPDDFDNRYRLPACYLFYPAQFWRHKNHTRLVQALALARASVPDLSLVLAGSEKNSGRLVRSTVRRLGLSGSVSFLGYVPDEDIAELYRRSCGLVMPTFFGPTNIPPLEAMATGTPMALSDIYAMREQSGDAAIYFDPYSIESISQAMVALASSDDLRGRLIRQGAIRHRELSQASFDQRLVSILLATLTP